MVTGGPGQKPDWKKLPGLSDSDMVTGGKIVFDTYPNFMKLSNIS